MWEAGSTETPPSPSPGHRAHPRLAGPGSSSWAQPEPRHPHVVMDVTRTPGGKQGQDKLLTRVPQRQNPPLAHVSPRKYPAGTKPRATGVFLTQAFPPVFAQTKGLKCFTRRKALKPNPVPPPRGGPRRAGKPLWDFGWIPSGFSPGGG